MKVKNNDSFVGTPVNRFYMEFWIICTIVGIGFVQGGSDRILQFPTGRFDPDDEFLWTSKTTAVK